ncbi:MAG: FAD-dependent monooxygenase [Phycicoccus sp.]|nr:FAD-dependent monooxygenase [Phycicoccus sp.]
MSETTTPRRRVIVAGGGIAGGVAALALHQRGHEVVLVEAHALRGIGHGITLQGNALKAFHSVGVFDRIAERGLPFGGLRMRTPDGGLIMDIPTPPMGGPELPPTMGALRADVANILADAVHETGIDVRLGAKVTEVEQTAEGVTITMADGSTLSADLLVGADGIRSDVRRLIGIDTMPEPVGMGIWRVVADRPEEMDCSELFYNGPKYKAGYTPISDTQCYAFLLEGNLDRSYVGEKPNGAVLKEHGQGYGGTWGKVIASIADDAIVNYQWIEAVKIDGDWYRGNVLLIGDAAHACPPLIAQGAAMSAEDGIVLADELDRHADLGAALAAFQSRRDPRVGMVLENSLLLAQWEINPDTPGADPGRLMGMTLHALCEPA